MAPRGLRPTRTPPLLPDPQQPHHSPSCQPAYAVCYFVPAACPTHTWYVGTMMHAAPSRPTAGPAANPRLRPQAPSPMCPVPRLQPCAACSRLGPPLQPRALGPARRAPMSPLLVLPAPLNCRLLPFMPPAAPPAAACCGAATAAAPAGPGGNRGSGGRAGLAGDRVLPGGSSNKAWHTHVAAHVLL